MPANMISVEESEPRQALPSRGAPVRMTRRACLAATLALTSSLVAGAWYVGKREGFAVIGTGGSNMKLLPRIGDPAPDVSVLSLTDERRVTLSEYRGKPVWLNFWGSWCPPCRAEFPDIRAAYTEALQPQGLVWLAISLDEPPTAAWSYAQTNGATFTILTDQYRQDTGSVYPIANFPTHILVGRDGIVRDIILAAIDKDGIIAAAQKIIAQSTE